MELLNNDELEQRVFIHDSIVILYRELNNNLVELLNTGNGRYIHRINNARSPIASYLSLVESEPLLKTKTSYTELDFLIDQYRKSHTRYLKILQEVFKK